MEIRRERRGRVGEDKGGKENGREGDQEVEKGSEGNR